jgi:hypothetical protein
VEKTLEESQILCLDGLEVVGIGLDIWMRITIKSFYLRRKSNIGRMWMFMFDELNM